MQGRPTFAQGVDEAAGNGSPAVQHRQGGCEAWPCISHTVGWWRRLSSPLLNHHTPIWVFGVNSTEKPQTEPNTNLSLLNLIYLFRIMELVKDRFESLYAWCDVFSLVRCTNRCSIGNASMEQSYMVDILANLNCSDWLYYIHFYISIYFLDVTWVDVNNKKQSNIIH
jgi:hypothetical protein